MSLWEKHHASIQKSNKKPINPRLKEVPNASARGIPPLNELRELLKTSKRIDPSKFLK
jgi:hypothetical protein